MAQWEPTLREHVQSITSAWTDQAFDRPLHSGNPLIGNLESFVSLAREGRTALGTLTMAVRLVDPRTDLLCEGDA